MIVIVDYGMGNLNSIRNMLQKIGVEVMISSDPKIISKATKIILPGVGAFDEAVIKIKNLGIDKIIKKKVLEEKIPILGICLGMQLFMGNSEEGKLKGLGLIEGKVLKFKFSKENNNLKIPHMGWNNLSIKKKSPLFKNQMENQRFYFVHSYYVVCEKNEDILSTTHHGYDFVSAVQKGNIFGTQFHPEKSHKFGMILLKNFTEIT